MRVIIWCDMEGVAGIEVWEQVMGGSPLYEEGRRLFTGEVNAAVRGAKASGATEIVVVDCHGAGGGWSFKSLIPERLESGAEYVFGCPWARYIAPLEAGCDAALFVGAHAMAGTPDGVLCHTVSSEAWYNATINETLVGESGILAAICGCWDVPGIFVAGDEDLPRGTSLTGRTSHHGASQKGSGALFCTHPQSCRCLCLNPAARHRGTEQPRCLAQALEARAASDIPGGACYP